MEASTSIVKLTKGNITNVGKHRLTSKELYNAIDIAMQSNVCTTIRREKQKRYIYCIISWVSEMITSAK